jgi:hypothetical protein
MLKSGCNFYWSLNSECRWSLLTWIISLSSEHNILVDDGWTWSALIPQQIETVLRRVNEACFRSFVGCESLQVSFTAVMKHSDHNKMSVLWFWLSRGERHGTHSTILENVYSTNWHLLRIEVFSGECSKTWILHCWRDHLK